MHGARRSAQASAAATIGAAIMVVGTACATTVTGSGQDAGQPDSAAPLTSAESGFPSASPSLAGPAPASSFTVPSFSPPVIVSSSPVPKPPTSTAIDVHYRTPRGFGARHGYSPAVPLEHSYKGVYLVPKSAPKGSLDVLSILLYRTPANAAVTTTGQQRQRIEGYNAKLRVRVTSPLHTEVVGGRAGFEEAVVAPGAVHYLTWLVFRHAHLVQVSCQLGQRPTVIETGCVQLVDSLTIN